MNFAALQSIVASDSRSRGAPALCRPEFLRGALRLLTESSRIVIITGFYVQDAGAPETDGPPGAVVLGRALERAGKSAVLLTDGLNYDALAACSRSVGGPAAVRADSPGEVDKAAAGGAEFGEAEAGGALLVFIERPGHAADGRYYHMRGRDISAVAAPLDRAADSALARGVPVLGVGDGGNEAGMGALYEGLAEKMPGYACCLSRVPATVCLPADVSNWGAYALAALLSASGRRWLGLGDGEEAAMLEALLRAGAVDGTSGTPAMSVDGVSLSELNEKNIQIKNWYLENFRV
ncbi:MAG: DUF4392 domain-containing protein [Synergistaceae bacterium]|jgi:hypothetical protein|nr:DUF4392 domain-containing protein [Synergistaceae bacterium]